MVTYMIPGAHHGHIPLPLVEKDSSSCADIGDLVRVDHLSLQRLAQTIHLLGAPLPNAGLADQDA